MDNKEFYNILNGAKWCSKGGLCVDDNGNKCPLYYQKQNCTEAFSKFIRKYEKIIRANTQFCEHCGALIEKGDNDD